MMIPVFEKNFEIKTYEGDKNSDLRIVTLMNLFQDCADDHASNLCVGMEHCLRNGLAWVGAGYHIKINRLPKIHEKIVIKTWPSSKNRLMAVREFEVRDEKNGEILVNAASQWVLISVEKKRPVALDDNLPDFPDTHIRAVDSDFAKIVEVAKVDFEKPFFVRFDDIDINGHVNNAVYPLWANEGVPADFRMEHSPVEIEVSFKKEGMFGEAIKVLTQIDGLITIHSIRGDDGRELARLKIEWRKNQYLPF